MRDLPGMVDGWDLRGDPAPRPHPPGVGAPCVECGEPAHEKQMATPLCMACDVRRWEAEHQWPEDGTVPAWAAAIRAEYDAIHAQPRRNILFRHREPAPPTNVVGLAARRALTRAAHRLTDGGYLRSGTAPKVVADELRAVADAIEADHAEMMNRQRPPLGPRRLHQAEEAA